MTIRIVIENTSLSPEDFTSLMEDSLEWVIEHTPVDTGYCASQWNMFEDGSIGELFCDCEYAQYLDQGWSSQAPNGITEPFLQELPSLVEKYR